MPERSAISCKSAYQLAERSIFEKQKERFIDAKQYAEDFIRRYVSGKYLNEVKDLNKKQLQN